MPLQSKNQNSLRLCMQLSVDNVLLPIEELLKSPETQSNEDAEISLILLKCHVESVLEQFLADIYSVYSSINSTAIQHHLYKLEQELNNCQLAPVGSAMCGSKY